MADLVETVARGDEKVTLDILAMFEVYEHTFKAISQAIADHRRAAMAAQLDDMAEPSEGMIDRGLPQGIFEYHPIISEKARCARVWQAMLAQYRKEMLGED